MALSSEDSTSEISYSCGNKARSEQPSLVRSEFSLCSGTTPASCHSSACTDFERETKKLKTTFHLNEVVIYSLFKCWSGKGFPLRGKFIVTNLGIFYYASFFNRKKKLFVPINEITDVEKVAKNRRSINIRTGSSCHLFSRFNYPDAAHDLLLKVLREYSGQEPSRDSAASDTGGSPDASTDSLGEPSLSSSKYRDLVPILEERTRSGDLIPNHSNFIFDNLLALELGKAVALWALNDPNSSAFSYWKDTESEERNLFAMVCPEIRRSPHRHRRTPFFLAISGEWGGFAEGSQLDYMFREKKDTALIESVIRVSVQETSMMVDSKQAALGNSAQGAERCSRGKHHLYILVRKIFTRVQPLQTRVVLSLSTIFPPDFPEDTRRFETRITRALESHYRSIFDVISSDENWKKSGLFHAFKTRICACLGALYPPKYFMLIYGFFFYALLLVFRYTEDSLSPVLPLMISRNKKMAVFLSTIAGLVVFVFCFSRDVSDRSLCREHVRMYNKTPVAEEIQDLLESKRRELAQDGIRYEDL